MEHDPSDFESLIPNGTIPEELTLTRHNHFNLQFTQQYHCVYNASMQQNSNSRENWGQKTVGKSEVPKRFYITL